MAEPVRRSKRGVVHEDHGHDEELSIKIPRLDDLKEEDDKKSHVSVSPAVGVAASSRRDSRLSQGMEKPAELFRKDLISAMKLPDTDQLQQDDYVLISDHWKQEWEHGVQVPVNPRETIKRTISIRKVAGNENLHGSYAFKMPKKFLHATSDDSFKQGVHELHETQKLADQMCRYDLDDLDVVWLSKMNDEREAMGLDPVAEWVMEKVVDEMEAQCYSNMQNMIKTVEGLGIEYDENVTCDVCRSPEGEDNNEIVFCDGCDICVHQACYGIQKIPEGSWLCRTCALGIKPKCILCPKTGGAMKSTKSGTKWSHVSCALWIPEVSIGCPEKMEPITKISQIPSSRWSLICNICREREGACIQCSLKTCKTAFHVTCAFNNNLHMKTMLDEDHDDVQLKAYCAKHSGKQRRDAGGPETTPVSTPRKDAGTPKRDRILLQDPLTPGKRESEMTEEERTKLRSHRLGKLAEEFYMCVEVSEVAEACKMDEDTIDFFYNYWVLKRKSNFNKPLLTPKTEEADLLLRQREDSLVARMKMFIHLRQDLERVRNLCYMVSRREKIRRSLYSTKEEIFYQQVALINSLGKQSNTRDYNLIVRAHREPQTVYDKYAAIIHTAKLLESRYRLEEENATESESDNAGSVISSVASSTTAGKSKAKRVRDSKRRLAFAKSKAKKQMNTAAAATQESGDVKPLVEAGVDILRDSGQDMGAGDAPTTTPEKAEVLEPTTSTGKSRRGRKPLSFWQKKRSRRSIVRMAASSKPPDESHQPVMDTSVSEAEVSMSEETPADSQVVGDSPKESSSVGDSPKGRSRRSLRSRDSLAVPVQVAETSSCDDKVEPAKVEERTKEKTSAATSVETDIVVAAAEDKSDHEGASEVPKEEPKLENREDSEPVPSDSNEAESADQSVSEPRTTRTSRRNKNVTEPLEPSNSSKVSPSKRTRKSEVLTEDTKSEAPVVEEKSSENCDSEKLDKDSESNSDLESVDTGSNYSPKVTRRRSALERSISSDSVPAPKLGGNGTSLPQVEVSVDEASGKISLRMRKPGLTEIPAEKQNGTPEIVENNKPHRHSMDSVDLDAVSVDGSSSPKKDRLRVQRRSSSRLQSLGINGLVSPSQLVVRQEIKDKVHSRLGIHRVTRQHNGLTPSQVDTLLTASRRIKSPSKVDVTREILEGSLTKENHPGNCPLLSKYPISIDLAEKPGKLSNSRRSSVFSDKQETTPAMSTRSSRATTPEMYSSRRAHGNVIDISDSEDSLNLLAASDSEYAPSEDSEASGAGTRRHTRRSVALAIDDDASRDSDAHSDARLTPRGGATTAKIASS